MDLISFLLAIAQGFLALIVVILIAICTVLAYTLLLPFSYLQMIWRTVAPQRDSAAESPEEADGTEDDRPPTSGSSAAEKPPAGNPDTSEPGEPWSGQPEPREPQPVAPEPAGPEPPVRRDSPEPAWPSRILVPFAARGFRPPGPASDAGRRDNAAGTDGPQDGEGPAGERAALVRTAIAPPPRPGQRRSAWPGHHVDENVAMPSYFFGPLGDDAGYVVNASIKRAGELFDFGMDIVRDGFGSWGLISQAGVMIGLFPGVIFGSALMAVFAVAYLMVSALTAAVAACVALVIRGADTGLRLVDRIKMPCPAHGGPITSYPVYICQCGNKHRDIRPGRHGIKRRICRCEKSLPTSLLFGAGELTAECPDCGVRLPHGFGAAGEIVVPFVGAGNVGKTQLMFRLYQTLSELVPACGGSIEVEDHSKVRLDRIADNLKDDTEASDEIKNPGKTSPDLPRAYVLQLTVDGKKRHIYFFDPAGELHYQQARLRTLSYLRKARIIVFVADPLAVDSVWNRLPPDRQRKLAYLRSRAPESDLTYQQTRQHMIRMRGKMRRLGGKRKSARLAFVVSKADLIAQASPGAKASGPELRRWIEAPDGLDMGNIVRESTQNFTNVEFFQTAAVTAEDGLAHESVETLAQWLLRPEGIILERAFNGS